MLLLVLILVLLAFALLVVALLSGSVLAAWVSVGLSVVAAVVLLVDWLQRRAAVKAGEASLLSSGTDEARPAESSRAQYEPEPATEVLPVVPPSAVPASEAADVEVGTMQTPAPPARSEVAEVPPASAQRTMVIAPVEPSGSVAQPPGAEAGTTSSSGSSSPSVTKDGVDAAGAESRDTTGLRESTGGAEEPTSVVDTRKKTPSSPVADPVDPAAATADHSSAVAGPAGNGSTAGAPSGQASAGQTPAEQPPTGHSAGGQAAAGAAAAGSSAGTLSGSDLFGSGAPAAEQPVQEPAAEAPAAEEEPPQEQADPAAAALVAGLEDEVIVIDEQPRYHVVGCRSLTAQTPIPLPAREAVELGFTPCAWCSPDRTLAERHPATAR